MFNEILRIKPVLDRAGAASMEASLSARFRRVAGRFGSGLMKVVKGSILGISLGLLNRLLNPIEALEEKIKGLLGQGSDIRDMADRFNTTPGQLMRLQNVGESLGVKPDQLNDMMSKYAQAIETARKEVLLPMSEQSEGTRAVSQFIGEKDLAESFFSFLQGLQKETNATGRKEFFGANNSFSREITGKESRQNIERSVFGETLPKRFIEANIPERLAAIGGSDAATTSAKLNKLADLHDQQQLLSIQNKTKDFLAASDNLNPKIIQQMEAAQALEDARATRQIQSYDDLAKAANGINSLKEDLSKVAVVVTQGLGMLGDLTTALRASPLLRGFFKGGVVGKGKGK